jgi:flavin-dependent dehydrogenase
VIPVGNAAAALEPIGGEGMGLAMRSAELAAEAILYANRTGTELDAAKLRKEYRRLWNMRRFICRAGAKIISSPGLSRLTIPLAAAGGADGPGALALRLVGKR